MIGRAQPERVYLLSGDPQHFLYFLPLPHGHGWLRPTFVDFLAATLPPRHGD